MTRNNTAVLVHKNSFVYHLLTSETRAAKGFSHAYILMILIPDTTSFIVRILLSVRAAVLLLEYSNKNIILTTSLYVIESGMFPTI